MIWNKKTLTSMLSAFSDHSREKLENISKKRLTCARKTTLSAIISACFQLLLLFLAYAEYFKRSNRADAI